jgi:hypothetical protein
MHCTHFQRADRSKRSDQHRADGSTFELEQALPAHKTTQHPLGAHTLEHTHKFHHSTAFGVESPSVHTPSNHCPAATIFRRKRRGADQRPLPIWTTALPRRGSRRYSVGCSREMWADTTDRGATMQLHPTTWPSLAQGNRTDW